MEKFLQKEQEEEQKEAEQKLPENIGLIVEKIWDQLGPYWSDIVKEKENPVNFVEGVIIRELKLAMDKKILNDINDELSVWKGLKGKIIQEIEQENNQNILNTLKVAMEIITEAGTKHYVSL